MRQAFMPTRATIIILGALVGVVFGAAVLWFVLSQVFLAFASVGHDIMVLTGTNSTTTDLIEVFMDNAVAYMAVIALIVFAVASWQYSQKKGVVMQE